MRPACRITSAPGWPSRSSSRRTCELVAVDRCRALPSASRPGSSTCLRADLGLEQRLADALLRRSRAAWRSPPCGSSRCAPCRARRRASRARSRAGAASPTCFRKPSARLSSSRTGLGRLGWPRLVVASSSPKTCRASISPRFSRSARLSTYCTARSSEKTRLAHLALAGLDLLRDRDLLLAREERDAAHLLEVHAHRIGGLAGRALDLLGLGGLLDPHRARPPSPPAPRRAPSPRRLRPRCPCRRATRRPGRALRCSPPRRVLRAARRPRGPTAWAPTSRPGRGPSSRGLFFPCASRVRRSGGRPSARAIRDRA